MLPLATQQCSLTFTILQSVVGGLFGSLGFLINILVIRWAVMTYQKFQNRNAVTEHGT